MTLSLRRRSLSESCALKYESSPQDEEEPVGRESLERRSKSEGFICTAQGVMFQTAKSRYQSKLDSLVEMAATASGSQSNVLLAKKALRYRKVLERRHLIE